MHGETMDESKRIRKLSVIRFSGFADVSPKTKGAKEIEKYRSQNGTKEKLKPKLLLFARETNAKHVFHFFNAAVNKLLQLFL